MIRKTDVRSMLFDKKEPFGSFSSWKNPIETVGTLGRTGAAGTYSFRWEVGFDVVVVWGIVDLPGCLVEKFRNVIFRSSFLWADPNCERYVQECTAQFFCLVGSIGSVT